MDIKLHKKYQNSQDAHWWFRVRDTLMIDIISQYVEPGCSILDFGCNYGHAVRLLKNSGYQSVGVDISKEAIEYGKSLKISDLFLLSEVDLGKESFDAVLLMDVIEHIEDDKNTLSDVYSKVKPGGIVLITVPAFMFLWGVQDEVSHHFRRYRLSELESLTQQVGDFQVIKKTYFNTFLFLPILLFRLLSKICNMQSRNSDLDINNGLANKIFFMIFNAERKLLKYVNFPFGVSALLVLRKK